MAINFSRVVSGQLLFKAAFQAVGGCHIVAAKPLWKCHNAPVTRDLLENDCIKAMEEKSFISFIEFQTAVRQIRTPRGVDYVLRKLDHVKTGIQNSMGNIFLVSDPKSPYWIEEFTFMERGDYFVLDDWLRTSFPAGKERDDLLTGARLKPEEDHSIGLRISELFTNLNNRFNMMLQEIEALADYSPEEKIVLETSLTERKNGLLEKIKLLETEWREYPFWSSEGEASDVRSIFKGFRSKLISLSDRIDSLSYDSSLVEIERQRQACKDREKSKSDNSKAVSGRRILTREILDILNQDEIKSGIFTHLAEMGKIRPGQRWMVAVASMILDADYPTERFVPLFDLAYSASGNSFMGSVSDGKQYPILFSTPGASNSLTREVFINGISLPEFFRDLGFRMSLSECIGGSFRILPQFNLCGFDFGVSGVISLDSGKPSLLRVDNIKMTVVNTERSFVGMRFYFDSHVNQNLYPYDGPREISYVAFPTEEIPTLDPVDIAAVPKWGKGRLILDKHGNGNLFMPRDNWGDVRRSYNQLLGFFRDNVEASKMQSLTKYREAVRQWHLRLLRFFAIESFNIK